MLSYLLKHGEKMLLSVDSFIYLCGYFKFAIIWVTVIHTVQICVTERGKNEHYQMNFPHQAQSNIV